jgi:hypothetical protein
MVVVNVETAVDDRIYNLQEPLVLYCVKCGRKFTTNNKNRALVMECFECLLDEYRETDVKFDQEKYDKFVSLLTMNYRELR